MIFWPFAERHQSISRWQATRSFFGNLRPWEFEDRFNVSVPDEIDHIDLIEVALKGQPEAVRRSAAQPEAQDLPIEPEARITPEQRELMREYCTNDLQTTIDKFKALGPRSPFASR